MKPDNSKFGRVRFESCGCPFCNAQFKSLAIQGRVDLRKKQDKQKEDATDSETNS